ncbi:hypothetical protein CIPAW_13G091100 [Carya illinoinensis]|uniref:Uncharacterized protein n=1 Tax=Carya illinoinensis TaxID=32201 RepID=A0A8T1NNA3_CARIL|nr:hypothetical protein CIPAW_13G091100 [Carya illinoinensis]
MKMVIIKGQRLNVFTKKKSKMWLSGSAEPLVSIPFY